jgi:hypothetical protein
MTASKYQSGEIDRSGRISRCGHERMRVMLNEAAQSILRSKKMKWKWGDFPTEGSSPSASAGAGGSRKTTCGPPWCTHFTRVQGCRPAHSAFNELTTVRPTDRTLLCTALAAWLSLAGCASERLAPNEPTPVNAECQQMRDKLATDQTLTPTQAAEITKNMERAGCGRRLPRP